jgi:hypothetical protein
MVWRWLTVIVVRKGLDMVWRLDGCISMQNLDIVRGGNRIAMIDCDNEALTDGDIVANARLIAAAPDLLAALEEAYRHFLQHLERDWFDDDDHDVMQKMFDVISKAKGEA